MIRHIFALICLAFLFAMIPAKAQDLQHCNNADLLGAGDDGPIAYCETAELAKNALDAVIQKNDKNTPKATPKLGTCGGYKCYSATIYNGVSNRFAVRYIMPCPVGKIMNSITGSCMDKCSSRPQLTVNSQQGTGYVPSGSVGCNGGCLFMQQNNGDGTGTGSYLGDDDSFHCDIIPDHCSDFGTGFYLNYGTGYCQPPPVNCKENQVKDPKTGVCTDACPAGMILGADGSCKIKDDTCPAGQTKGPDGSCVNNNCPSGQVRGSDGTCKKNNDPNKDNGDDDKYFSGGDDCNSPPACSGDQILCGQAKIQWRIDCNTRKRTNVSGGGCAAMPVCTGENCDALQYSQLLVQWRGTCALEKMAGKGATGPSDGNDDGNGDKQPGWTKVTGMSQDAGQGETEADKKGVTTRTLSASDIDSSGFLGGGGGCPAIAAAAGSGLLSGYAAAFASPPAFFCDFIGMIAAITVLGAAVWCAVALAKG